MPPFLGASGRIRRTGDFQLQLGIAWLDVCAKKRVGWGRFAVNSCGGSRGRKTKPSISALRFFAAACFILEHCRRLNARRPHA